MEFKGRRIVFRGRENSFQGMRGSHSVEEKAVFRGKEIWSGIIYGALELWWLSNKRTDSAWWLIAELYLENDVGIMRGEG